MGIAYHTTYAPDGAAPNLFDRVVLGVVSATYATQGSAGTAQTCTVSWSEPVVSTYTLLFSPVEDCTWYFGTKTPTSAVLTITPRLASGTLTGGTGQVLIIS